MFYNICEEFELEAKDRKENYRDLVPFGIKILDDALFGICRDDLILVGAASGAGKTQLVTLIANGALSAGKKVHMIALESSKFEIPRRLKFGVIYDIYKADRSSSKPFLGKLSYPKWLFGKYGSSLEKYEDEAIGVCKTNFKNLFLHHKEPIFGIKELIENIALCQEDTGLIIIDHAHYFDFDDDNENRALKNLAKTLRHLAIDCGRPIVLVAHLRKRDKFNGDLAPGMEEFHGSSDLFKIATKVITIAPGSAIEDGKYETFFRISKFRIDGTATRFLGRCLFDPKNGRYDSIYKIGFADQDKKTGFIALEGQNLPEWARTNGSGHDHVFAPEQ